ncbi:MAG: hypothetical protein ACOVNR_04865, partial [Chitinophagaceae bacterium]
MRFLFLLLTIGMGFLISCQPPKKSRYVKTNPEPAPVVRKTPEPVVEKDPLTPFTKDLFNKLLSNQIDLKRVQFYIDQEMILNRYMENGKMEVTNGVIKFVNGKNVNEIIIPAGTPCAAEYIEGDAIRVSFDKTGSTFRFQNSRSFSPDYFVLTGANWKDGTCEIEYDGSRYRVSCGSCSSAADIRLMVKQSTVDSNESKTKRL